MTRQLVSSGGPWEKIGGYSRAVRVGHQISVAGPVATTEDGSVHAPGDCYEQTMYVLGVIERALNEAGASLADVVRTRSFVTDIAMADDYVRAHGAVFADIRPASTLVEVSGLLGDGSVIEIEADAIVE